MQGQHASTPGPSRGAARLADSVLAIALAASLSTVALAAPALLAGCGSGTTDSDMPLDFSVLSGEAAGAPPLQRFVARDGTALEYRHYPADSPTKLVLLHGSGSHSRYFAGVANAVAESGAAEVFTPDLRGHGARPARRGDIDYIDQLEDDVADLIAHIRERSSDATTAAPQDATILVGGHSSGGGLALRFAGSPHADEASGYLLLAPFLKHDAPTTRANAGGWAKPKVPRIVFLSILNGFGVRSLNDLIVIEFDMPEIARDGTETLAYSFRLNTGYAPRDYEKDLAAIASAKAPLLVIIGDEDEALVAEAFPEVIEAHAPRGRVEILPGESHLGLVVGEAVRSPIVAWIEEQGRAPSAATHLY